VLLLLLPPHSLSDVGDVTVEMGPQERQLMCRGKKKGRSFGKWDSSIV
jgi:hypothetical protein